MLVIKGFHYIRVLFLIFHHYWAEKYFWLFWGLCYVLFIISKFHCFLNRRNLSPLENVAKYSGVPVIAINSLQPRQCYKLSVNVVRTRILVTDFPQFCYNGDSFLTNPHYNDWTHLHSSFALHHIRVLLYLLKHFFVSLASSRK